MTLTRPQIWKAMEQRQELEALLYHLLARPEKIRRRAALLEYAHAAMFGKPPTSSPDSFIVTNTRTDGGILTVYQNGFATILRAGESLAAQNWDHPMPAADEYAP